MEESYLHSYLQSAKEKPISISGGISLFLSIVATINFFVKWVEEGTMNIVLLIIPVFVFFVILLIYTPYAVYKKERNRIRVLQEAIERGSTESLRELRRQLREPKVVNIPDLLQKLHHRLQELADLAIKNGIDEAKMHMAAGELLESFKLDKDEYTDDKVTKAQLERSQKILKKQLNIKSVTDKGFVALLFKVIGVLEKNGVGFTKITDKDDIYESLNRRLDKQRRNISSTKLAAAIDGYLWYSRGFACLTVWSSYYKPIINDIPAEMAAAASLLPKASDTVMQFLLADVNKCIEDYLLGETSNL